MKEKAFFRFTRTYYIRNLIEAIDLSQRYSVLSDDNVNKLYHVMQQSKDVSMISFCFSPQSLTIRI
jgi:hypothetical protein